MDSGPVTSYRVVMEPKYFTETRAVCTTEYQDEVRYRTRTVARQVPVEVQDYRTTTVMVPKTETKTIEYTVLVPEKKEKTVELVETVPVWNEVTDTYTVRVPTVVDVPEEYTVRVPKLRDEQFTYTVYVPQAQKETRMQTVTNAVPVSKTRTIQVNCPVTRMETRTKDYGHWEVRVEEVGSAPTPTTPCGSVTGGIRMGGCGAYSGSCGACGGCGQVYHRLGSGCRVGRRCGSCDGHGVTSRSCGPSTMVAGEPVAGPSLASSACAAQATRTVCRRVWVPNVVTEEVPVVENVSRTQEITYTAFEQQTEQIPYECTYLVYVPEERSGTRQVVDYIDETRTRTRKVVQYNEETRTRTRKELSYKQETRTMTVPYVTHTTQTRTKEVSYTVNVPETKVEPITTTRFDTVNEEISEEYTVRVPVPTTKEVQVPVCRMVPKLVPVTIYPCSVAGSALQGCAPASGCAGCSGSPAATVSPSPTVAPTPTEEVPAPSVAPAN